MLFAVAELLVIINIITVVVVVVTAAAAVPVNHHRLYTICACLGHVTNTEPCLCRFPSARRINITASQWRNATRSSCFVARLMTLATRIFADYVQVRVVLITEMSRCSCLSAATRSVLYSSLVVLAWFVVESHAYRRCTQTLNHAYLAGATTAEYPGTTLAAMHELLLSCSQSFSSRVSSMASMCRLTRIGGMGTNISTKGMKEMRSVEVVLQLLMHFGLK